MEIEVEAERPEDSLVQRASAKRSSEKSRKRKHRSSNHDGSADGSRKHDSKPKIFRLLRSRGRLSDYKAKLTQFLSGIISRNVLCTFLTETLSKSEIRHHNKFILGVLRNDRHKSKQEKKSTDENTKSKHYAKRERSANKEALPEQTANVTKDRDGFTVPPPKKEKHHSKRVDNPRRGNGDHEYSDRSAQNEISTSPTMETHRASKHAIQWSPQSAELALPADLTKYLQGLDADALEHLLQETSMISQHLQGTSTAPLPRGAMEQSQNQAPQIPLSETFWEPPPQNKVVNPAPCQNESFPIQDFNRAQDFNVPRVSTLPAPTQHQSQYAYGNPYSSHFGNSGTSLQHEGQYVAHDSAPVAYGSQNGYANFVQPDLQLGFRQTSVQPTAEAHFGTNVSEPFVGNFPNDFDEMVPPTPQPGMLPGMVEDFQKAPDSSDPNLWWNSIVEPSVFQRGYQVVNGADANTSSYERSAMWAQQFLQSNEHENDYIYTSKA